MDWKRRLFQVLWCVEVVCGSQLDELWRYFGIDDEARRHIDIEFGEWWPKGHKAVTDEVLAECRKRVMEYIRLSIDSAPSS